MRVALGAAGKKCKVHITELGGPLAGAMLRLAKLQRGSSLPAQYIEANLASLRVDEEARKHEVAFC